MAPAAAVARPVARRVAWVEIAALALLLLSYIWLWQGSFRGSGVAVVALYFGIGLESHLRRGETPRQVGIRLDNLGTAVLTVLRWVGPLIVGIGVLGALLGTWHLPHRAPLIAGWDVVWGTAQQYGLLCVFYRRLCEVLPGRGSAEAASGLLFALFHLPNPFLTAVALPLGILACCLYRHVDNLFALGAAHGALAFTLAYALPWSVTFMMRVGPRMPWP
ncbi:MAG: type II CAAX prenyl endopeptidase Rce1 family protein [Acidobacteriota bacterium]